MPMKSAMEYSESKGQRFENNKDDVGTTWAPSMSHTRTPAHRKPIVRQHPITCLFIFSNSFPCGTQNMTLGVWN